MYDSKKKGGNPRNVHQMLGFAEVIEDCGLVDLPLLGILSLGVTFVVVKILFWLGSIGFYVMLSGIRYFPLHSRTSGVLWIGSYVTTFKGEES